MTSTWTEEKLARVVTLPFIHQSLPEDDWTSLNSPLPGNGEDSSNGTYGELIAAKAKRVFLILLQIGAPRRIFIIIDQAFDDDDLPLSLADIARLELSAAGSNHELDSEFRRAQAQFISLGKDKTHKGKRTKPSQLAFQVLANTSSVMDVVRVRGNRSKVFSRRRIVFAKKLYATAENDFAREIHLAKKRLCHHHIVSLRAAYFSGDSGYVILHPVLSLPLQTFFSAPPKTFMNQSLESRLATLMTWPHCIAGAMLFLHDSGFAHGRITPGNIFVANMTRVYLGFPGMVQHIQCQSKESQIEAYKYCAPESLEETMSSFTSSSKSRRFPFFKSAQDPVTSASLSSLNAAATAATTTTTTPTSQSTTTSVRTTPSTPTSSTFTRSASTSTGVTDTDSWISFPSSEESGGQSSTRNGTRDSYVHDDDEILPVAPVPTARAVLPTGPDPRHTDIFSLGCVTLDILSFAVQGKQSAPIPRRDIKRSRTPKKSSSSSLESHSPALYANTPAVLAFMDELQADARAQFKAQPERQAVLRGIPAMLALLKEMLDPVPMERPPSVEVVRQIEVALMRGSRLSFLHCGAIAPS